MDPRSSSSNWVSWRYRADVKRQCPDQALVLPLPTLKMQRAVSSLSVAPPVKVKLISAGFHYVADLCGVRPLQLCKEAGISQHEALEVLQEVQGKCDQGVAAVGGLTALELLEKEQELGSIVTFCSALDSALGGGLPVGKTSEVCGAPGVGKTQLCIQLAVDVQIPVCFGGLGGHAVYIDTEGSFLVQRAVDMAEAAVQHCSMLAEDTGRSPGLSNPIGIFHKCFTSQPKTTGNLVVRLIVIDSIAFPFRHYFEDFSQRTRLLNGLAQQLIQMATKHHVAVVLTNQMTTKVGNGQSKLVPALGESWGHAATQRLILQWEGQQRLASLYKSPSHPEATVPYQITSEGFRDMTSSNHLDDSNDSSPVPRGNTCKRFCAEGNNSHI
ncbi:hypothetical protein GN956_G582 [Arapaima gigas]